MLRINFSRGLLRFPMKREWCLWYSLQVVQNLSMYDIFNVFIGWDSSLGLTWYCRVWQSLIRVYSVEKNRSKFLFIWLRYTMTLKAKEGNSWFGRLLRFDEASPDVGFHFWNRAALFGSWSRFIPFFIHICGKYIYDTFCRNCEE